MTISAARATPPRRRRWLFARRPTPADDLLAGPAWGELLGAEGLAERARDLARGQVLGAAHEGARQRRLLIRLDDTRRVLAGVRGRLATAADAGADVSPAGDWLLDNYHVIEEHVREVRASLPRGYYRELPELAAGRLAGYPRVYEIATTLIGHSEGRVDRANAELFVAAFQEVTPLTLGELWAVPAMLRLALLESVRRTALRTARWMDETEAADRWATRLLGTEASGPQGKPHALDDYLAHHPPLTPTFVSRFLRQMRRAADTAGRIVWLEPWMTEEGVNAEDAAARANERLALTQVMTANGITSLRAIERVDWKEFVERQSVVEAVLRADPGAVYARMTFATRDRYRHVVERIARRTARPRTRWRARMLAIRARNP